MNPPREKTPFKFLLKFFAVIGLGLAGIWWLIFPPPEYLNYRMIVEVDDNGKLVRGSSVVQASIMRSGVNSRYNADVSGEAAIVDLGERGRFFVVFRGEGLGWSPIWAQVPEFVLVELLPQLPRDNPDYTRSDAREYRFRGVAKLPDGVGVDLNRKQWPLMVRFRDLNDPLTIEKVDPDNLAKTFGAGVRLVRLRVERTRDPVTQEIENVLPWLKTQSGAIGRGETKTKNELFGELYQMDFKNDYWRKGK